jgi:hypothetical protein
LIRKITEGINIEYREAGNRKILQWVITDLLSVLIQEAALNYLSHAISNIKTMYLI